MTDSQSALSNVLPDIPEEHADKLDFYPYASTLAEIILDENTQTPLTIGIFGGWGSGKTSLMKMVEKLLDDPDFRKEVALSSQSTTPPERQRVTHSVWFNAWLYSKEEMLWRALIAQVIGGIRGLKIPTWAADKPQGRSALTRMKNDALNKALAQLYRVVEPSQLGSFSIKGSDMFARQASDAQVTLTLQQGLDLLDELKQAGGQKTVVAKPDGEKAVVEQGAIEKALQNLRGATAELERARIDSLVKFQEQFAELISAYVAPYGYLVVFVDDLDRCLPEKAVEVLEAMKLFLDVPGCIFVLGIDQEVIERGIQIRYGEKLRAELSGAAPFLVDRETLEANDPDQLRRFWRRLQAGDEKIIDGGRYLEKIIQIPFTLPPISRRTLGEYIGKLTPNLPDLECRYVFAAGLEPNPRQVKRALNIFTLLWRLSRNKTELRSAINPVRLAKIVVLQQRHVTLYDILRQDPSQLIVWEQRMRFLDHRTKFLRWAAENRDLLLVDDATILESDPELFEEEKWSDPRWDTLLARPDTLEEYPEFERRALRDLLLRDDLDSPGVADSSFFNMYPTPLESYVYLAQTAEEGTTSAFTAKGTGGPLKKYAPVEERRGQSLRGSIPSVAETAKRLSEADQPASELIVVGQSLDESTIGTLQQYTSQVMDQVGNARQQRDSFRAPAVPPVSVLRAWEENAAQSLRDAGANLYMQSLKAVVDVRDFQIQLAEDPARQLFVDSRSLQLPWEISINSQDTRWNELWPHFWGARHRIYREMPGQSPEPELLRLKSAPWSLLLVKDNTARSGRLTEELRDVTERHNFMMEEVGQLSQLPVLLQEMRHHIIFWHGSGSDSADLWLQLGDERLTRRHLDSWRGPLAGVGLPRLFIFDVDAGLGRRGEWPTWLELLAEFRAESVVAPMAAGNHAWSSDLLSRFLKNYLSGQPVSESLLKARQWAWQEQRNPLGLFFAAFGDYRLPEEQDIDPE